MVLVSGPNELNIPPNVKYIPIKTADEMLKVVDESWKNTDIFISSAAVADFKPEIQFEQKVKKEDIEKNLKLAKNPDILATLSKKKGKRTLVGFAVETENDKKNAMKKMKAKNLDMIIVNNPKDKDSAFASDKNKVMILNKNGDEIKLPLMTKGEVAQNIFNNIK